MLLTLSNIFLPHSFQAQFSVHVVSEKLGSDDLIMLARMWHDHIGYLQLATFFTHTYHYHNHMSVVLCGRSYFDRV